MENITIGSNDLPDPTLLDADTLSALSELATQDDATTTPAFVKDAPVQDDGSQLDLEENKPTFTQHVPYSSPLTDDEFDYELETAFLPSGTASMVAQQLLNSPKQSLTDSKAGQQWAGVIAGSKQSNVFSDGLVKTVMDPTATFEQGVQSDQGLLVASSPKFTTQEGVKYTGEKARLRVRQALRLGVIINIPLWHSGFWIRIKAPSEGELLELYRQITAEKITLGRATYGLLFSNNTSYSSRALLDFCIENMYETSLILKENEDIRPYIKTLDLPILFWGLACSIWPNGFQHMRSCIADVNKCNHVIKEKLDLSKLQFTNTSILTKRQINHMTKRQRASMTPESLERYHEEFISGQIKDIKLSDQVKITVKIPNALEHIDAGYRWVNAIEENYGKALIQEETKRDNYFVTQGKATVMRQYAHFVHSLTVQNDVYDDRETIEDILNDLTASDELRDKFLSEVANYIDDSVVSLIAIPTFTCPMCKGKQKPKKEHKNHPDLIPVDVNNVFFTLAVQKINRIEAR